MEMLLLGGGGTFSRLSFPFRGHDTWDLQGRWSEPATDSKTV